MQELKDCLDKELEPYEDIPIDDLILLPTYEYNKLIKLRKFRNDLEELEVYK